MSAGGIRIGIYSIKSVLAPMAGYTDIAFRELCRECGADLTVTEMVSVRGIAHGNEATRTLMRLSEVEKPSSVQLFGSSPDDFARAASVLDCDIIDINMGCPMPKIVKNGDGAALLKDPRRAGEIVRALKNSTDKPITVKTRLGYGIGEDRAAELIESVAAAGASAVAVHGRYAEQRYSGESDIRKVKEIARQASIPVIPNGDISSAEPLEPFGAVMIGRAALSDPAVFVGGGCDPFDIARRHIGLLVKYFDERYTVIQARKFFVHYFKGLRGGKALRDEVNRAACVADVLSALDKAQASRYNNENKGV